LVWAGSRIRIPATWAASVAAEEVMQGQVVRAVAVVEVAEAAAVEEAVPAPAQEPHQPHQLQRQRRWNTRR